MAAELIVWRGCIGTEALLSTHHIKRGLLLKALGDLSMGRMRGKIRVGVREAAETTVEVRSGRCLGLLLLLLLVLLERTQCKIRATVVIMEFRLEASRAEIRGSTVADKITVRRTREILSRMEAHVEDRIMGCQR